MIEAHQFDGMVMLPGCDKIVPGMLMAAMRLNIPAIVIQAGPCSLESTRTWRRSLSPTCGS